MANRIEWSPAAITTANTAMDGTGTVAVVFSADEECYVSTLKFRAAGSNVATVARLFINNGKPNAVPSNNSLWDELTLPSTTASAVASTTGQSMTLGFWLPKDYRLLVTIGTSVAAGYYATAIAWGYDPLNNTQRT